MPSDVDDFADEVESRNLAAFHGSGAQLCCVHATRRDFCFFVAFRPCWDEDPAVERGLGFFDALIGPRGWRMQRQPPVGKTMRKNAAERCPRIRQITLRNPGAKFTGPEVAGREIDHNGFSRLPVRRDLQNRRSTEAAVSKEKF